MDPNKEKRKVIELKCPQCGKRNYYFRSKSQTYFCRGCGCVFKKDGKIITVENQLSDLILCLSNIDFKNSLLSKKIDKKELENDKD